jgi:hypothetical protein
VGYNCSTKFLVLPHRELISCILKRQINPVQKVTAIDHANTAEKINSILEYKAAALNVTPRGVYTVTTGISMVSM